MDHPIRTKGKVQKNDRCYRDQLVVRCFSCLGSTGHGHSPGPKRNVWETDKWYRDSLAVHCFSWLESTRNEEFHRNEWKLIEKLSML